MKVLSHFIEEVNTTITPILSDEATEGQRRSDKPKAIPQEAEEQEEPGSF